MTHKKPNLPTKICPACNRPFAWRKKWEKVWEQVRYCSEACRKVSGSEHGYQWSATKHGLEAMSIEPVSWSSFWR